jgi:hypothetical protein
MVGPPSSWSRDQEESNGKLGQWTVRAPGVRRSETAISLAGRCRHNNSRGSPLASGQPSIPLFYRHFGCSEGCSTSTHPAG